MSSDNYVQKGELIWLSEEYESGGNILEALVDFNMKVVRDEAINKFPSPVDISSYDFTGRIKAYLLTKKFAKELDFKYFTV